MSNEVLNSSSPSSIKFDDLAALEITDPVLLSAVAAAAGSVAKNNSICAGDGGCYSDGFCVLDGLC